MEKFEDAAEKRGTGWRVFIFCAAVALITGVTALSGILLPRIGGTALRIAGNVLIYLLLGAIALGGAWLLKLDFSGILGEKRQFLFGVLIAAVLSFAIAILPALLGASIVGGHTKFTLWNCVYCFCFYVFAVGPVEEFVFRFFVLDFFRGVFAGREWLAVLCSSLLFGVWHLINGSLFQVALTFAIGCVFGFSRTLLRKMGLPGLALAHGLYDFSIYLVTCFIL